MIEHAKTFVCDADRCGSIDRVTWRDYEHEKSAPEGWLTVNDGKTVHVFCPRHEAVIRRRRASFSPQVLVMAEEGGLP